MAKKQPICQADGNCPSAAMVFHHDTSHADNSHTSQRLRYDSHELFFA